MAKWLRWIIVLIFGAAIMAPALLSPRQYVELRLFLPPLNLATISIGAIVFIFSAYGACAAVLLALLDRAQLSKMSRNLKRKNGELERELAALRQLMAGEKTQDD